MYNFWLLIFGSLLSFPVKAGEISKTFSNNPKFITAFDHAQAAFLIQTGFDKFQSDLKGFFIGLAKQKTEPYLILGRQFLKDNNLEKPVAVGTFLYYTISNKELKFVYLNKEWKLTLRELSVSWRF